MIGIEARWGVAGITVASGLCAWVEFALLRRSLARRIGRIDSLLAYTLRLWAAAGFAAALALAIKYRVAGMHPVPAAAFILVPYGLTYFAAALVLKIPEARLADRLLRPFRRR
jgi:putative peptidoglycan lipid II flippase